MRLLPDPARLLPRTLTMAGWVRYCKCLALLTGLLVAAIDFGCDIGQGESWREELLHSLLVGAVTAWVMALALNLAGYLSRGIGGRVSGLLRAALASGRLPPPGMSGWPLYDEQYASLQTLLAQHEMRVAALERELAFVRQLAEEASSLELVCDAQGKAAWVNAGLAARLGLPRESCLAAADVFALFLYPSDRHALRELCERALAGAPLEATELRLQTSAGQVFWCLVRVHAMGGSDAPRLRFSALDIQPRKDAELRLIETVAALRRTQALKEHYLARSNEERQRLSALLETLGAGILFIDSGDRVIYANRTFSTLLGLPDDVVQPGKLGLDLLPLAMARCADGAALEARVLAVLASHRPQAPHEMMLADGRRLRESAAVIHGAAGEVIGRVWVYEDVSAEFAARMQWLAQSERDGLTGLGNRRAFEETWLRVEARAARRGECAGLIAFSPAEACDDAGLRSLARRLQNGLRRDERLFRATAHLFVLPVEAASAASLPRQARRLFEQASGEGSLQVSTLLAAPGADRSPASLIEELLATLGPAAAEPETESSHEH